jgi:hypothetical protein
MNKDTIKSILITSLAIAIFVIPAYLAIHSLGKEWSAKSNFSKECPKCKSANIHHEKPEYTHLEHRVIPSGVDPVSKPIAHFTVKYHCKDCNHTFHKELEKDLFLTENKKHIHIEYKE